MGAGNVLWWSGLAGVLGGAVWIVAAAPGLLFALGLASPADLTHGLPRLVWHWPGLATTVPPLLFLAALAGLHRRYAQRPGQPRLMRDAGLFLAAAGSLLLFWARTGIHWPPASYGALDGTGFLLLGVGMVLLGLDGVLTGVMPGGAAFLVSVLPLVVGSGLIRVLVLGPLWGTALGVSFGAGWIWLGWVLWRAHWETHSAILPMGVAARCGGERDPAPVNAFTPDR